jgi:ketosteroid isomerase-like protein
MSEENVEKIRKAIEDFNRRDFDAALAVATEDFTWEPFLEQTATPLLRGKAQVKAAWESQVELLDLRVEPREFIAVDANNVVVTAQLVVKGKGSGMPLTRSIALVYTFGTDGLITSVDTHDSREEALEAAGLSE